MFMSNLMISFVFIVGLTVGAITHSPILCAMAIGALIGCFIIKTC